MNCKRVDRLVCDYFDATLSLGERRELDEHAANCPECTEKLAETNLAIEFLNQAPKVEPPVDLIADILHQTIGTGVAPGDLALAGGRGDSWLRVSLRSVFYPFFEPRFAMTLAFTVLSFSLLTYSGRQAFQTFQNKESRLLTMFHDAGEAIDHAWVSGVELYETMQMSYQIEPEFRGAEEGGSQSQGAEESSEGEVAPAPGER